jgi:hypothetical protein
MRRVLFAVLLAAPLALALLTSARSSPDLRPIRLPAYAGHVKVGQEKQSCFPVTFPRDQTTDVGRVEMYVHGGSHHVHLYRPTSAQVYYPLKNCPFAIDFSLWELVTATQTSSLNWQLHPGVGINFSARQPLLIQTHFVNTGALSTRGSAHAKIILHPMDPATVTAHGGALFGQDRTVVVPPGRTTLSSTCALTGPASDNRQMTLMALTGHYHFRGIRFEVWHTNVDGSRGEQVYSHDGYSDPEFKQFQPGELVLQPGEGLEWACTWQNDTDKTFLFGPNTQNNEHCNLFGFYYPTDTPQETIDCVHRHDAQGNDVNDRIQAH